jgi:hypothetical protein
MHKMKNQKLLSEYQKGRLLVAMEALHNPIFSMLVFVKAASNQLTRKFEPKNLLVQIRY